MDPFDHLLRTVRAEGAAFGRSVLAPPRALRFTDGASLTLCVPMRGGGWVTREGEAPRPVRPGETAIVRGPEPFVFSAEPPSASRPQTPRDVRFDRPDPGPPPGADPDGRTVLLAGAYHVRDEVPRRLLRVLPPLVVVADDQDCTSMRDYLEAQLAACLPGRQIVLDRLLDWLLVCTLREWFDRPEAGSPAWYRALTDDVVGPVLHAVHEAPERPWSLASLAGQAGVSRTTLAKRFTEVVGEPPLSYLTDLRMAMAADLLAGSSATVAAVAHRVGYADAFGFSAAFKRVRGVSPTAYRRAAATGEDPGALLGHEPAGVR
ncbi:AraC family transcriptional regulator [Actinomadura viridis]|uniref:AraC family transcriptional regulator n=1 Tax=Actinomadura viridis TaxID=58110 RepID=UPI0036B5463D